MSYPLPYQPSTPSTQTANIYPSYQPHQTQGHPHYSPSASQSHPPQQHILPYDRNYAEPAQEPDSFTVWHWIGLGVFIFVMSCVAIFLAIKMPADKFYR